MSEFDIIKNPNEEEYKSITEAVVINGHYCPCSLEKTNDSKCMCKEFRDSKNTDFCHCGRFYKIRNYETLAVIGDISEEETAQKYLEWCEVLNHQDFIVTGILLDLYDINYGSEKQLNLYRAIIAKADALLILGHEQKMYPEVEGLIDWATSIGKKVLTREDLIK